MLEIRMPSSMFWVSRRPARPATRLLAALAALAAAAIAHNVASAAALPTAPQTFDTRYAAPSGATLTVAAGDDLQAALEKAQLGDTIVLEAGATFTGPFKLPNKTTGNGWIYVVSSKLTSLPAAGERVGPNDAVNMPKIVSRAYNNAVTTIANSHHFRFVGIEFAPVAGGALYDLVVIGSKEPLPHHIVFDRCYVHGDPGVNDRRGIVMNGAFVAVVDSYISDFQEVGADSQGLLAYNTSGPLQIRNNYIEAAGENVMFGGADSSAPALVPGDIEISNNYFFKPLSLIPTKYTVKNMLEFKAARRVRVAGNTFENNPLKGQNGFAVLITPRNQSGTAPWSATSDIAITDNVLINVGSGFNIAGGDNHHPVPQTERILIRNNVIGVTGLNGADGRTFQFMGGGTDYTIDHNTIINSASPPGSPASDLAMVDSKLPKISNFLFTNNLSTRTHWGFFGNAVGEGNPALNGNFTNWIFSKNVLVGAPAGSYPSGNFFPTDVAAVRFANPAGGKYSLAADSPYKNAGTDGTDIGANGASATNAMLPNPPTNVVAK
jgi:hypothetical protein